ncbi:MAG: DNA translocase FtsK, partial [Dehalococcoidia bacterium]|nr:DNA translocase FtsK [Dehalococcoidia bacterium]
MPKARPRRRQKKATARQIRAVLNIVLTRQFAGFILVLIGAIILFSLVGSVEPFAIWWQHLFGWAHPLALAALVVGGFLLALAPPSNQRLRSSRRPLSGLALGFVALMAILSIITKEQDNVGGLLGTDVGLPLRSLVGPAGAFVVLLLLGVAAVLWGYKVPPRRVLQKMRVLGNGVKTLSRRRAAVTRPERPTAPYPVRASVVRPAALGEKPEASISDSTMDEGVASIPIIKEEAEVSVAKAISEEAASLRRAESGILEWQLPPIDLLDSTTRLEPNEREIRKKAQLIEETLAHFGVPAKVSEISQGPVVTQFGVEPGFDVRFKEVKDKEKRVVRVDEVSRTKVKVSRITSLANDLALALSAQSLRIQAPVPGRNVVGIVVPNTSISLVGLRGVV